MPRSSRSRPTAVRWFFLGLLTTLAFPHQAFSQLRPVEQAEAVRADALGGTEAPPREDPGPAEEPDPTTDRTPLGVDFKMLRLIAHQDQADSSPALGEQRIEIDPALPAPPRSG